MQPAGREVLGRGFTLGRRELVEIRCGHRERARARRERPASSDVDAAGGGRTSPILIGGCDNRERDGGTTHFFSSRVVRIGVSSLVNVERIVSVCTRSLCFLLIRNVDRWRRSASPSRSGGVRARIILPDPSPPLESSSPDDSSPFFAPSFFSPAVLASRLARCSRYRDSPFNLVSSSLRTRNAASTSSGLLLSRNRSSTASRTAASAAAIRPGSGAKRTSAAQGGVGGRGPFAEANLQSVEDFPSVPPPPPTFPAASSAVVSPGNTAPLARIVVGASSRSSVVIPFSRNARSRSARVGVIAELIAAGAGVRVALRVLRRLRDDASATEPRVVRSRGAPVRVDEFQRGGSSFSALVLRLDEFAGFRFGLDVFESRTAASWTAPSWTAASSPSWTAASSPSSPRASASPCRLHRTRTTRRKTRRRPSTFRRCVRRTFLQSPPRRRPPRTSIVAAVRLGLHRLVVSLSLHRLVVSLLRCGSTRGFANARGNFRRRRPQTTGASSRSKRPPLERRDGRRVPRRRVQPHDVEISNRRARTRTETPRDFPASRRAPRARASSASRRAIRATRPSRRARSREFDAPRHVLAGQKPRKATPSPVPTPTFAFPATPSPVPTPSSSSVAPPPRSAATGTCIVGILATNPGGAHARYRAPRSLSRRVVSPSGRPTPR